MQTRKLAPDGLILESIECQVEGLLPEKPLLKIGARQSIDSHAFENFRPEHLNRWKWEEEDMHVDVGE